MCPNHLHALMSLFLNHHVILFCLFSQLWQLLCKCLLFFSPWKAYAHILFSLEFKVEKLLQNINTIPPKVSPTSTPPPDTYLPREVKKKKKKVPHYNSQLLQRPNMHSAFKLNKLLSHKALRPVQEFKLCCREIVPMSMWLINPSERIRGTFPEELYHGLTRLSPSSIF